MVFIDFQGIVQSDSHLQFVCLFACFKKRKKERKGNNEEKPRNEKRMHKLQIFSLFFPMDETLIEQHSIRPLLFHNGVFIES